VTFDPFGVKDEPSPEPQQQPGNARTPSARPRPFLNLFLALNAAFLLLCAGGLAARMRHLLGSSAPAAAASSARNTDQPAKPAPPAKEAPAPKPAEPPAAVPAPMKNAAPAQVPAASPAKAEPKAAPAKGKNSSKPVDFSYSDPAAKEVQLLGPFLVRSNGRKSMFKDSSGEWRLTLYLMSGETYRYRFESADDKGRKRLSKRQSIAVP
jgi:hypothetical protein